MPDVKAALDAMAAAEQEARDWLKVETRWAHDRVALVARDRATLERHVGYTSGYMDGGFWCQIDRDEPWPCPDARAVIEFWTQERG